MIKVFQSQFSQRKAFIRGFWNGMAAPALLFTHVDVMADLPTVPQIELPKYGPGGPLADDWGRIAGDFRRALARHEGQAAGRTPAE